MGTMKSRDSGRINPKNYSGQNPTAKSLSALLPRALETVTKSYEKRPDHLLAIWPQLVGPQIAKETKAVSFQNGFLLVHVSNSTLLSLLSTHEKPRLLQHLRKMFPKLEIKSIVFKMGSLTKIEPV